MTSPLRPCGRPGCRLCDSRYPEREALDQAKREDLAHASLGIAAIILIAIFAFVLLPVLAA